MSEELTVEQKAEKMGWVPKEDWKGDPDVWRPAEEFVERGENIVPILKDRIDKLESDLATTIKINKREVSKAKKESYDRATREYNEKLEKLQAEKFEAIQDGDIDRYAATEKKIVQLEKPAEPDKDTDDANTGETPVFAEWKNKNTWYGQDRELSDYAEFIAARLDQSKHTEEQFYAEVEKRVRRTYPDKFKNPNRDNPGMVDSSTGNPNKGGAKKTFADLPPEAKATYNRLKKNFERQGREFKKEDYAKTYFED
jgi:hypothetical protein